MDAGQFRTIQPHFNGKCTQISGVIGAEDITIHPETGIAYISSFDRRAAAKGDNPIGRIYAYDLNTVHSKPVVLSHNLNHVLHPHGISLYASKDGPATLFVVNHAEGLHTIEVFLLMNGKMAHQKTLHDPVVRSPNDIVAVGPDKFYVTNDHKYTSGLMRTLEDYGRLKLSSLVYYDGQSFREAASGFSYPNGVNVSKDGRKLYMTATTESVMYVFKRDIASGDLDILQKVQLDSGGDNIEIDTDGDIWIGAHPQLLKFVAHAANAANLSASQVLHLSTNRTEGKYKIDEIYLNDGKELSGSSVAVPFGKRLLIGSVFEPVMLDCMME